MLRQSIGTPNPMPITLQTYDNGKGVRSTYSGIITDDEYLTHIRLYPSLPRQQFEGIRYGLTDLTDVNKLDLSTTVVIEAANVSSQTMKQNPNLRIAIAAPNDLEFGMSRIWSAWSDSELTHTALFRSVAEATEWLHDEVQRLHGEPVNLDSPDTTPAFTLG